MEVHAGDKINSSPAVANGVVYVGSWDKNVYALDATLEHSSGSTPPGVGSLYLHRRWPMVRST